MTSAAWIPKELAVDASGNPIGSPGETMANGAWLPTVQLVDLGGNVVSGGGAGTLSPTTGDVGTRLTATLPAGVIGTIQFTRTLRVSPFTKTAIAGALANSVNTLSYVITSADANCNVGYDASSEVSSSTTVAVPAPFTAPAVVLKTQRVGGNAVFA